MYCGIRPRKHKSVDLTAKKPLVENTGGFFVRQPLLSERRQGDKLDTDGKYKKVYVSF